MKRKKEEVSSGKAFQHLAIVFEPPANQNLMSPYCNCSCCGTFTGGKPDLQTSRDAALYARGRLPE